MAATLKERVEELEKRLEELTAQVRQQGGQSLASPAERVKDWRRTIGTAAGDPGFDEMIELGREIRRKIK
jgi:hypothetical protein